MARNIQSIDQLRLSCDALLCAAKAEDMAPHIPQLWITDGDATAQKLKEASELGARLVAAKKTLKSENSKMSESTGVKGHCKELMQKIQDFMDEVAAARAASGAGA